MKNVLKIILTTYFCFSLFDESANRYAKLRDTASKSIIIQFGLSIFTQDSFLNYVSESYNFYLCPKSFGNVIDDRFFCQASSLEFLCRYNFDFTKVSFLRASDLNPVFIRHHFNDKRSNIP